MKIPIQWFLIVDAGSLLVSAKKTLVENVISIEDGVSKKIDAKTIKEIFG